MLPTFEKTYPPEVAKMRQFWFDQIEEVKRRYEPSRESMTAIQMVAAAPKTPEECDRLLRRYRAEIEPFVQQLLKIEAMTPTVIALQTSEVVGL
jgi:hypothetical protein